MYSTKKEAPAVHYELTNHLGNVLSVITPDASDATQPAIESLTDYYPFGMEEPGRSYSAEGYRYGFNGKENVFDDSQDYGERIYKPNIARFLSADPLIVFNQEYPELSPYQFASNTPIGAIDLDGLEAYISSYGISNDQKENNTFIEEAKIDPIYNEVFAQNDPTKKAAFISAAYPETFSKQLQQYSEKYNGISYLSIYSHASCNSILVNFLDHIAITYFDSKRDAYDFIDYSFETVFKDVTFTSDALLVIGGCNSGNTYNDVTGEETHRITISARIVNKLKIGVIAAGYQTYPKGKTRAVSGLYVKNNGKSEFQARNYRLFYLDENGVLQIEELGRELTSEIIKKAQGIINGVNEKKNNINDIEEKNIDKSN